MDNLTIFGGNKRDLRKLKILIEQWLHIHSLKLKSDWQIFDTNKRMPDAMGFRYGKTYTIPRKYNLLRLKRYIKRYRKRRDAGKSISAQMVSSIMSRLGQLKHCNNNNIYNRLFQGEKIMCEFRKILRRDTLNTKLTWDSFLEYFTEKKLTIEGGESMDSSTINIIVSVITGVFTVLGAIIASTAGNKSLHDKIQNQMRVDQAVTDNKIETLTAEVKKHNDFASRVPVLEEQMKSTVHRLESIEKRMERED